MNGSEIKDILIKDWRIQRVFRGVFSCDLLPKFVERGKAHAFVINTDPSDKPGEHWVALYINPFGKATYFDSFGVPNLHPYIYSFTRRNSIILRSNELVIQRFTTRTCGLYCIYFIRQMTRGKQLLDITRLFNAQRPAYNDRLIVSLVLHNNQSRIN